MTASDHLSDLQFRFNAASEPRQGPITLHRDTVHRVAALTPGGEEVGSIEWNQHNGRVDNVNVNQGRRRQGMATRLWQEAHANAEQSGLTAPVHSDIQFPDGKAWVAGMARKEHQQREARRQPRTREAKAVASEGQGQLF